MLFPQPQEAYVIRYFYLWNAEHERGQEEGVKDRPCAIVLLVKNEEGKDIVTVLPITHTPPSLSQAESAMEIPADMKRRLGLDDMRSWVMLTEANRFTWPGPDLRMAAGGDAETIVYGRLPKRFFYRVRGAFIAALESGGPDIVSRGE
ncbi:MAG: hypothetical protein KGI29_00225 [Pseudomonadota bacterium]|nr:hypothetical protein [Pseudomonadota bacterium]MDE3038439.1 hypothetical protein [Pseudomonadota bacterium]